ncbi:MAG: CHAT domain-containing protein [Scytonema sp. PMC 1070.18]|nr:CHAT domain-containing protein [Scytonema sp. PMC 1070.18]
MIMGSKVGLIILLTVNFAGAVSIVEPHLLSLVNRGKLESNRIEAEKLFQEASKQYQANQLPKAIDLWQQALNIYLELDDKKASLTILENLIAVNLEKDYSKTIAYLQQYLTLTREIKDKSRETTALITLAKTHTQLSKFIKVAEYYEQALNLVRETNNKEQEKIILANLAIAYKTLGNYVKAIEFNKQSLKILQEVDNPKNQGKVLNNLGNAYEALGDYDNAIASYNKSLEIARQINDKNEVGLVLNNLGQVYANQGKDEEAIATLEDSLKISSSENDIVGQASTLINLGSVYHVSGKLDKAKENYQQSLKLARQVKDKQRELEALTNLGLMYEDLKDYSQAIECFEKSLAIAISINNPKAQALTLNNLGHTLLKSGSLTKAEEKLRKAVDILDKLRSELSDTYQISIFDTQIYTYNLLQQILVAQNKPEAALEVAEQGRARAFIDLLANKTVKNKGSNSQVSFNINNPSIKEIRETAKAQNATLVEYTIVPSDDFKHRGKLRASAEEIYIWVVKPTGKVKFRRHKLEQKISLKELVNSGRTCVIKDECRGTTKELIPSVGDMVQLKDKPLDVWEVVDVDSTSDKIYVIHPSWRKEEDWKPGDEKNLAITHSISDVKAIENSSKAKKQNLYQLHQLLIEPIADILPKKPENRIIFVPQEDLFLVPFAALKDSNGKYLIEKHTILTAPSIQVLSFTHRLKNSIIKDNFKSALVVGNPTMPTIPGEKEPLGTLPNSGIEANNIAEFLQTTSLTGSQATKVDVVKKMPNASLIHLATHGLLDEIKQFGLLEETKQLSPPGAIALAPSHKDSGFLTSSEIMDMELKAQMVVLSACNTGRGEITGDGVVGLSRSFIAAGVPSVVVSLWAVPDAPTSELMTEFYLHLSKTQKQDKAKALRQAMLKILKTKKYKDPKNWAAFTLIGEAE